MRIGVLGQPDEKEVRLMTDRLREMGVDPVVVNLEEFPKALTVSVEDADGLRFRAGGEDVTDVAAWYVRRFGFVDPLIRRDEPLTEETWGELYGQFREWYAAEGEKAAYVGTLLRFLHEHAPLVNPPEAFIGHNRKLHQVHQLRKAGLPIPDYVYGNDPDAIRAFMDRHERVVYKPMSGPRHVFELKREVFDQRAHALATEPICVQQLVEGRHVRAYVVGDRVVGAAEILFDREKDIDYRKSQRGVDVVELPAAVQENCVRAARACGMPFTGLDVILGDDGATHHFLECNPSAMFANFERMSGIPVSRSLAELLVETAKDA